MSLEKKIRIEKLLASKRINLVQLNQRLEYVKSHGVLNSHIGKEIQFVVAEIKQLETEKKQILKEEAQQKAKRNWGF